MKEKYIFNKKTIEDIELKNKKVLLRLDLNVPFDKNKKILDNTRIIAVLPTIKYLLKYSRNIIILSHLGRIKKNKDKINNSLYFVSLYLSKLLKKKIIFINENFNDYNIKKIVKNLKNKEIIFLENTRFKNIYNNSENNNDIKLSKFWASLADIFVNDAFGMIHRKHASNVGIANTGIVTVSGFLIKKEMEFLNKIINNNIKPFILILGGSKISDKICVIEKLILKADYILLGGCLPFTFYKALNIKIGKSIFEEKYILWAKEKLNKFKNKLILPIDYVVVKKNEGKISVEYSEKNISKEKIAFDIGPKTVLLFKNFLEKAKILFWSGPMGMFEVSNFSNGTFGICKIISMLNNNIIKIAGGGDTVSAINKFNFKKSFTYISTGGSASLKVLENNSLPGLDIICSKK